eukprot:6472332-Amphidinium_carterae.1
MHRPQPINSAVVNFSISSIYARRTNLVLLYHCHLCVLAKSPPKNGKLFNCACSGWSIGNTKGEHQGSSTKQLLSALTTRRST